MQCLLLTTALQDISDAHKGHFKVRFEDLRADDGEIVEGSISLVHLTDILPVDPAADPLVAVTPTAEVAEVLASEFSSYSTAAAQGMMAASYLLAHLVLPCLRDLKEVGVLLTVRSVDLPIGAGLGSSAAFAVAVSGACTQAYHRCTGSLLSAQQEDGQLTNATLTAINAWAYAGEVLIHGLPSGLDNTTSCFGGMVRFAKGEVNDFQTLANGPMLDILLTNTRVPRSTKVLVAGVKALRDAFPAVVQPIFSSIQAIADTFLSSMSSSISEADLASLVSMNHHLLCALGVGHGALDEVHAASAALGFACKLTGAGGGGCAITLLTSAEDRSERIASFRQKLGERGFEVLQTSIGGQGVRWE